MLTATSLKMISFKRYLPILLCCLSLASCGGGGSNAVSAAGAVPVTTPTPLPGPLTLPVANSAPIAKAVAITDKNGGTSVVGDTLLGGYVYYDADRDIEGKSTFRWLRNGVAIARATATNYTIVAADVGAMISFEVTPVAKTGVITGQATVSPVAVLASSVYVSVSITPSRTACTAPCGIMFDSKGSSTTPATTQPFFELNYQWDYGDAGATFQQRPGINANKSSSAIGAHVYSKPGIYTPTLTVTDNKGRSASKQVVINVADPNVTYLNNTYCVSNTNNFTGCPASAIHLSSFSQASTEMGRFILTPTVPKRVLFHAGETFLTKGQHTEIRWRQAPMLVSSYGTGAKPIIRNATPVTPGTTIFTILLSDSVTFSGIEFSGSYSPITGTGLATRCLFFYTSNTNSLVYGNIFSGLSGNIDIRDVVAIVSSGKKIVPQFNMVVDNNITNWSGIGIFGSFGHLGAILGNSIKQNPLARSGPGAQCGNNCAQEGPIRIEVADSLLIQNNDMFNNSGWSSAGLAHQPCLRLGTNGIVTKSVVADNIMEGGFGVMEMRTANPTLTATQGEVAIERNKFTATWNTETFIDTRLGGSVIRNNLFIKPNNGGHPLIGTKSLDAAINYSDFQTPTQGPLNLTSVNQIYNNTLISLEQTWAPVLKFIQVNSAFTLFEIHNNLVYAPYMVAGGEGGLLAWKYNAPLTGVHTSHNLLFTPNNTNFVWNNAVSETLTTWQASGNGAGSMTIDPMLTNPNIFDATLQANSPAINAGININGLMSDFNNKPRTTIPDIGALEF